MIKTRVTIFACTSVLLLGQAVFGQVKPCKIPEFNTCLGIRTLSVKRIQGRVFDESKAWIPRSCVTAFDRKLRPTASATTDENGGFSLGTIKNGRYLVVVQSNGFTPISQEIIVNRRHGRSRGLAVRMVILSTDSCSFAK